MANTQDNVKAAFAGESQANRKYLFFAERAEKDGQPQVAKLFRAIAEAETVHARNHLQTLAGIGSTPDNLKEAISGEHHEFTEMYPEFIKQAEVDGNKRAQLMMGYANQVEEIHHRMYQQALEAVNSGKPVGGKPYSVCQVCGYTVEGEAPDKCPICSAPAARFKKVE